MYVIRPLFLAACTLPASVFAQTNTTSSPPSLLGHMGQMLFGLGIVIILLFLCLWCIKRLSAPRGSAAALKVLGGTAVGPRERVVLVKIGSTVLILGVAPGNVSTLHQMREDELPESPPAKTRVPPASPHFSAWLKHAMEKQKND